jgi:hypothetical protein
MSHVYIIEIAGRAMGLVARQENGESYRFHAAIDRAYPFDGQIFETPEAARQALRKALSGASGPKERTLGKAA